MTMSPTFVQVEVRMRRRRDIAQILTSGRCSVGDGQKMLGGRATMDTALQMARVGGGLIKLAKFFFCLNDFFMHEWC
jgi:hypothetical protein